MPSLVHETELLKNCGNLLNSYVKGQFSNLCDRCRGTGSLRCCGGGCLRAYHSTCLLPDERDGLESEEWECPICKFGVENKILPKFLFEGYLESMRCKRHQRNSPKKRSFAQEQFESWKSPEKSITGPYKRNKTDKAPRHMTSLISPVNPEQKKRPPSQMSSLRDRYQKKAPVASLSKLGDPIPEKKRKKRLGVTGPHPTTAEGLPKDFIPAHFCPPGTRVFVRCGPHSPDFAPAEIIEQDPLHGKTLVAFAQGFGGHTTWIPSTIFNFKLTTGIKRFAKIEGLSRLSLQRQNSGRGRKGGPSSSSLKPEEGLAEKARRQLLASFPHGMWDPHYAHEITLKPKEYRLEWDSLEHRAVLHPVASTKPMLEGQPSGTTGVGLPVVAPGTCVYISKGLAVVDLVMIRQRESKSNKSKGDHSMMVGVATRFSVVRVQNVEEDSSPPEPTTPLVQVKKEDGEELEDKLRADRVIVDNLRSYQEACCLLGLAREHQEGARIEVEVTWLERGEDLEINDDRATPLDENGVPLGGAQCEAAANHSMVYLSPRRNWVPLSTILVKHPEVRYIPPPQTLAKPQESLEAWQRQIEAWVHSGPDRLYFSHVLRNEMGFVTFDTPSQAELMGFFEPYHLNGTAGRTSKRQGVKFSDALRSRKLKLSKIQVLDLFCGVGGTSLGCIGMAAGCSEEDEKYMKSHVDIVGAVDSCPYACQAFAANIPQVETLQLPRESNQANSEAKGKAVKKEGTQSAAGAKKTGKASTVPLFQLDIQQFLEALVGDNKESNTVLDKISAYKTNPPDLVVVTAPCQNFSGLNRSAQSERWDENHSNNKALWTGWEVIGHLRPKGILMENVTGLVTFKDNKGSLLGRLVGQLLRWGYNVRMEVMAVHQYGVPSRRQRLILQAALPGVALPPQAVKVSADGWEIYQDPTNQRLRLYNTLTKEVTENIPWRQWEDYDPLAAMPVFTVGDAIGDLAKTRPYAAKENYKNPLKLRRKGLKMPTKGEGTKSYHDLARIGSKKSELHDHVVCTVNEKGKGTWKRMSWDEVGPTITGTLDPMLYKFAHPDQDRVFSVREGARIQGFRDHSRFFGSLTERYKQIANAVPPPLAFRLMQAWTDHLCQTSKLSRFEKIKIEA